MNKVFLNVARDDHLKRQSPALPHLIFGLEEKNMNYIYKITNLVNGKYYIGKRHNKSQDPLHDGYYGSGVAITKAIKKYGKENFKKEILAYCDTIEDLNSLEKQIITLDIVNDPMSYNMMGGGVGGSYRSCYFGGDTFVPPVVCGDRNRADSKSSGPAVTNDE